jgi:single-strand DNA-binding protein
MASGAAESDQEREVVMNQVALVGYITDDPELRYTQSGAAFAGFTVAVSHRSKTAGEWQYVNDGFFRCTAWRSVAENLSHTLKKGVRIFVAGKLVQRSWQDNDGNKRQTVEIQVTHMGQDLQFATGKVAKSTAEGLKSPSNEEKENAKGLRPRLRVSLRERHSRASRSPASVVEPSRQPTEHSSDGSGFGEYEDHVGG